MTRWVYLVSILWSFPPPAVAHKKRIHDLVLTVIFVQSCPSPSAIHQNDEGTLVRQDRQKHADRLFKVKSAGDFKRVMKANDYFNPVLDMTVEKSAKPHFA